MKCSLIGASLLFLVAVPGLAEPLSRGDRGVFVTPRNEFLESVRAENKRFRKGDDPKEKTFKVDFSSIAAPRSAEDFARIWHFPPMSQGSSGACWCFAATSFFESEIFRLTGRSLKLSEMHTVYWEYVEKSREWVRTRGQSVFRRGSENNAVPRIWRKYGVVPQEAYTGMKPGQPFHDHDALEDELRTFLLSVKDRAAWNEAEVVATVRAILDHHLGPPPQRVTAAGAAMTPLEYLRRVVRLELDDYVDILSFKQQPYHRFVEFEVRDNWLHDKSYFNVPLEDFMAAARRAVRGGYTLALSVDASEPGYDGHAGLALVPSFDIPEAYIDDDARQLRFSEKTTADDHENHLVGWTELGGKEWYLVKDSGSGSRNNSHPGYYFYRGDYLKLKVLAFMVHKDAVRDLLAKLEP